MVAVEILSYIIELLDNDLQSALVQAENGIRTLMNAPHEHDLVDHVREGTLLNKVLHHICALSKARKPLGVFATASLAKFLYSSDTMFPEHNGAEAFSYKTVEATFRIALDLIQPDTLVEGMGRDSNTTCKSSFGVMPRPILSIMLFKSRRESYSRLPRARSTHSSNQVYHMIP